MKIQENPTSMIQRINPSQCKFGCPEVVIIRGYDHAYSLVSSFFPC